jgi:hypothetical protein
MLTAEAEAWKRNSYAFFLMLIKALQTQQY